MTRNGRSRLVLPGAIAALIAGASPAIAQPASPQPDPPPPDTTINEPVPDPNAPPAAPDPQKPVKQGPAHVPPDASEIDLTTLETKNVSLLYFDPVQTYLTPYIARSFENALQWHEKKFQ